MIPIVGYEGLYSISNEGLIRNDITGRILKGSLDAYGYVYVSLYKNKKRNNHKIHRLLGFAFLNLSKDLCINHKDGNKSNNSLSNLEVCNHSENMKHAVKIGLHVNCTQKGENHNTSKHSFEKVEEIRTYYSTGKYTMRNLSKLFKVPVGYVSDVVNNKIRNTV